MYATYLTSLVHMACHVFDQFGQSIGCLVIRKHVYPINMLMMLVYLS